jgi:hypothetical protein
MGRIGTLGVGMTCLSSHRVSEEKLAESWRLREEASGCFGFVIVLRSARRVPTEPLRVTAYVHTVIGSTRTNRPR